MLRLVAVVALKSALAFLLKLPLNIDVIGALEALLHANFINAQLTLNECQQAIRLAQQPLQMVAMQACVEGDTLQSSTSTEYQIMASL